MGDCANAQTANAPYLILVSTSGGVPMSNVAITAGGLTGVTNSSGMTVLPASDVTVFETHIAGAGSPVSVDPRELPTLCLGDSYYRVLSLSANVTVASDP